MAGTIMGMNTAIDTELIETVSFGKLGDYLSFLENLFKLVGII